MNSYKSLFRLFFTFSVLLLFSSASFAQGEIDDQVKIFFRNERTYAFHLNSNGYGVNFRYAKWIDGFRWRIYHIDLCEIKHDKEIKISNDHLSNTGRFVFGKKNNFYNLRAGIGFQKEVFSKRDKGGIAIRYYYSGGTSLGILKPIYYEVFDQFGPGATIEKKFDTSLQPHHIVGKAPYLRGFNEISLTPGAFVKAGVSFEYSKKEEKMKALEAGVIIDAFLLEYEILVIAKNPQVLVTLFVNYRWGKIIDKRTH
jgi:hypothetical protein